MFRRGSEPRQSDFRFTMALLLKRPLQRCGSHGESTGLRVGKVPSGPESTMQPLGASILIVEDVEKSNFCSFENSRSLSAGKTLSEP